LTDSIDTSDFPVWLKSQKTTHVSINAITV